MKMVQSIGNFSIVLGLMTASFLAMAQAGSCGHEKCVSSTLIDNGRKIRYTNNCDYPVDIMTNRWCNGNDLHRKQGFGLPEGGGYWDQDSSVSYCSPLGGNQLVTRVISACRPGGTSGSSTRSPAPAPAPKIETGSQRHPTPPQPQPPPPPPPQVVGSVDPGREIFVTNRCGKDIRLLIRYLSVEGEWLTRGWYTLKVKDQGLLTTPQGRSLIASDSDIYIFVESQSKPLWHGANPYEFENKTYNFRSVIFDGLSGDDKTNTERYKIFACVEPRFYYFE